MSKNPLGENISSPTKYGPGILYPIPRRAGRSLLDIDKNLLMYGLDHWHAYELSWLDFNGKPQVAMAELFFDSDSENIVESKSLKLYLNSLNQEKFANQEILRGVISNDLSSLCRSQVKVILLTFSRVQEAPSYLRQGNSLDGLDVKLRNYLPAPELLQIRDEIVFNEKLYSDLFRSNCPITDQPDWASFSIQYTGNKIAESSLLAYLCSYREHQGYHEECAERIYRDLMKCCHPKELSVSLNFLRRGGLDINVYRSSLPLIDDSVNSRLIRQ
jgi:7-cyano-7-deazaguanine reductase